MAGLQLPNPPPTQPRRPQRHARQSSARHRPGAAAFARPFGRPGWAAIGSTGSKAPGRPDIAYPGRKVAIFVHGCYWHHCPRCYPNLPKSNPEFWARKFELNRERDARKRARP